MRTADEIVASVAAAVGLAEGAEGVRDVVRTVGRLEPVAVRRVSRSTELPIPIVAAVCNELRKRGVISRRRPVQLSPEGRELFGAITARLSFEAACPTCSQHELVVPEALADAARELERRIADVPRARLELDQAHCTVETKLRRVLLMHEAGALEGRALVLLGDDDLVSLALSVVAAHGGPGARIRRLVVVDVDAALLRFLRQTLRNAPFDVEYVLHDLREPLPGEVRGDTIALDPPYTRPGAELFLSRAAEAARESERADVFFSFGQKRPEELLHVQRAIAEMGFVVRRLIRGFNEYVGAGTLAGSSHLYHLVSTPALRPLAAGSHTGPLYTAEVRLNGGRSGAPRAARRGR